MAITLRWSRRFEHRLWFWLLLVISFTVVAFVWLCSSAGAANDRPASEELVREALSREVYALDGERQALLDAALHKAPDFAPARWHTGQVRFRNQWVKIEDVPGLQQSVPRYQEYLVVRANYDDTARGQLALAMWCKRRSLEDQSLAHLNRILDLAPNHPKARSLLGYRRVDGQWLTQQHIDQQREAVMNWRSGFGEALRPRLDTPDALRRWHQAFAHWQPLVQELQIAIAGSSARQQQSVRHRLATTGNPEAIPVIETMLANSSEPEALAAVAVLGMMEGEDASQSLGRQAAFSPWETVRLDAVLQLKGRDHEQYVPMLLQAMYTPITMQARVAGQRNGRFVHQFVFSRENQAAREELVAESDDSNPAVLRQGQWVEQQNERTRRINERIAEVLNSVTSQDLPATPEVWWRWWEQESPPMTASVRYVSYRSDDPEKPVIRSYGRLPMDVHSCFAAGTSVWTIDGLKAIEQIRVGDLVLSQHPETGELAYKPVLRTTVGPVTQLVRLQAGSDGFCCTTDHLFWVAGDGWVQARWLREGAALHCATGTARVEALQRGPAEKTYNLVVGDFGTYFIGQGRILVHDITPYARTAADVPGLRRP